MMSLTVGVVDYSVAVQFKKTKGIFIDGVICSPKSALDYVNDYADAIECAARIVTLGLLGQIEILDEEAA